MDGELIKLIIIGEPAAGKTTYIHRYVNNSYRAEYKSTIGVDFALKCVRWNDKNMKLQLWDIAGQERFTFMTRAYYKDARGCLLVFDLTSSKSFEKVAMWKKDLDTKVRRADGSTLPCLLIANKSDLPDRKVPESDIIQISKDLGFVGWMETSVKEGINVYQSVMYLLDFILGNKVLETPASSAEKKEMGQSVSLHQYKPSENKRSSCLC